ncbi:transmembrane secretion effector [Streptomyces sp. TLI_235]|nr:MFS transporter [Streptomyces sp. TLI_235]PBC66153.1 transmembrane secretion effector [Streptomyces sp. TLI_235]
MTPQQPTGRRSVLREPAFRRFLAGHTASLLGSAMAPVAVAFAVLDSGGDGTALGTVMAARILPIVLLLLAGGVVADRFGTTPVLALGALWQLAACAAVLAVPAVRTLTPPSGGRTAALPTAKTPVGSPD